MTYYLFFFFFKSHHPKHFTREPEINMPLFMIVNKPELKISLFGRRSCGLRKPIPPFCTGPSGSFTIPLSARSRSRPPAPERPAPPCGDLPGQSFPQPQRSEGLGAVCTDHAVASWPDTPGRTPGCRAWLPLRVLAGRFLPLGADNPSPLWLPTGLETHLPRRGRQEPLSSVP